MIIISSLPLVIAMMLLDYIQRKWKGGYKFIKLLKKLNHQMYMDDIKIFAKTEK